MKCTPVGALVALALTVAAPAQARTQQQLDRATVRRIADSAASLAERHYVYPDTGQLVAAHLRARLESGAYDVPMEPATLADRLTRDLQAINGDAHLYAVYSAAGNDGSGPRMVIRRPGEAPPAAMLAGSRRQNYFIKSATRLDGNVGYLALSQLSSGGSDEVFGVIDAAMAFLERTEAVIIDLRNAPGGEPRVSDYLASYFFAREGMPTLNSFSRGMNRTFERSTPQVTGRRRAGTPLFVLVGPGTASGAEDFAFIVQQYGIGTLVGEQTAGAGRLTSRYPVGEGIQVSISGGRTFDPRSGAEWERVGIRPGLSAPVDKALATAHAAALRTMALATADPVRRRSLEFTRTATLARAAPAVIAESTLRAFAGDYGLRQVRFRDGKLWYHRDATRPGEELVPVDETTFALGEDTRVTFVRESGRVTAFQLALGDGAAATFLRTQ